MTAIYGVNLPKPSCIDYREVLERLSEERIKRTLRYRKQEDRIRSVIAETLVRTLLLRKYGMDNHLIRFSDNRFGKPFLVDIPDVHFNVSHAGNFVLCAIGRDPIGIDIEEMKPIDLGIAARFFSGRENAAIGALTQEKRLDYFYQLWTAKESYIKFRGLGLSLPLNSFSVQIDDDGIELSENFGSPVKEGECYFKAFQLPGPYKITFCSANPAHPEAIERIDCYELFSEFIDRSGGSYATC